jgi:hypothetical protein
MHSYRALVLGGMVAALALTAGRGQDAKGVAKEVLDLAREAEADKDVAKKAAALKKRFPDVRQAMRLYNVRRRGGVGLGEKGVGIERRFVTLAKAAAAQINNACNSCHDWAK